LFGFDSGFAFSEINGDFLYAFDALQPFSDMHHAVLAHHAFHFDFCFFHEFFLLE